MALSGSFTTNTYKNSSYTLSWSATQSIANNQSTISWTLTHNRASNQGYIAERTLVVTLGGHTLVNKSDRVERYGGTVSSGSFTITHNATGGASMSGSISVALFYSYVTASGSNSWTLNTIPRQANLTSAPDFNDEGNPSITYNNAAGNSVTSLDACISLTGSTDDIKYRAINKTGTLSYTFNLTEDERNVLRNACTTANSRTVKFYVRTVIGGTTFYSILDKTLSIVNANPVITDIQAYDSNSDTVHLTGDRETMIRGYNAIDASMAAATYKGATVSKYYIKNGSDTVEGDMAPFYNTVNNDFTFTVVDSRGNTATTSITLPMIEYVNLTCDLNVNAPNAEGDMDFTISGNYWNGSFGAFNNGAEIAYRYKENDGEWNGWVIVEPNVQEGNKYSNTFYLTGLNYQSSYTFQATATDALRYIETADYKVKTLPIFDWGENDFNFNVPVTAMGKSISGVTLYDGGLTNEEITLSDSVDNYSYLEIFFTDNNGKGGGYSKVKLNSNSLAGSTHICLSLVEASSATTTYIRRTSYTMSGNKLTPITASSGFVTITNTSATTTTGNNYLRVAEVVGYK